MRRDARRRLVRDEAGFTLTEMMVTVMIMSVVLFALFGIFDMGLRVFSFGNDKVEATEQARLGMEKMTREIRAAYPVDKIGGIGGSKQHVFFTAGASATATRPLVNSITFGNDLPDGATPPNPPNRMVDTTEEITYALRSSSDLSAACPAPTASTQDKGICTLVRRKGPLATASFQPVVENVVPDGLTFEYLTNNMGVTDPAGNGTDIGVVRITLRVSVDRGIEEQPVRQTLTTDVDLKNR